MTDKRDIAPPIWEQAAAFVEEHLELVVEYIRRDTWKLKVQDVADNLKLKMCHRRDPRIKSYSANIYYTETQLLEWIKCSKDPIYFLTKYVKIVSVDDGVIPFTLWDYQKDVIKTYQNNRFVISMQSRQSGKCHSKDTKYRIRNKKTGEIMEISAEEFHELNRRKQAVPGNPRKMPLDSD
jgi:hypothetical protein